MPNSKSAKKALRQNQSRRLQNRSRRSALRTTIKRFRNLAGGEDREAAEAAFRMTVKKIDQSAAKGLIHKNTAARTKSRLAKLLNAPRSGQATTTPSQSAVDEPAEQSVDATADETSEQA